MSNHITSKDVAEYEYSEWSADEGENSISRLYPSNHGDYLMILTLDKEIKVRILRNVKELFSSNFFSITVAVDAAYSHVARLCNEHIGPPRNIADAVRIANMVSYD